VSVCALAEPTARAALRASRKEMDEIRMGTAS
jgi:hypothetical protein